MTEAMTRVPRRPSRKSGATKKSANRFASLAGGDDSATGPAPAPSSPDAEGDYGLIAAVSAAAAATPEDAMHVVQVPVDQLAPHPFNDPARSQPEPEDPKWQELLNSVRSNGVRLPVLAVPREAFVAARPTVAHQIPEDAKYVLVYGHRRRTAALEAGRATVPAVIDDAIMDDDGDLDAMATENLARKDLSELAEADLFARYAEMGLKQRSIEERLGVDQTTVSRRLSLHLMAPEVRDAMVTGIIRAADAAKLAGGLPFGPRRAWQRGAEDPDQNTAERAAHQVEAMRFVLDRGMTAAAAVKRVVAEAQARQHASELGVTVVDDIAAELGETFYEHRVLAHEGRSDLIGAIDPALGTLTLYARNPVASEEEPDSTETPSAAEDAPAHGDATGAAPPTKPKGKKTPPAAEDSAEADDVDASDDGGGAGEQDPEEAAAAALTDKQRAAAQAAQAHRREACAALITQTVSKPDLLKILVSHYLSGVAIRATTSAVRALLKDWDAYAEGSGEKAQLSRAWHHAVAAAELHTTELRDKAWDDDAVTHVRLLIDRVGYQPTAWEREQLNVASV